MGSGARCGQAIRSKVDVVLAASGTAGAAIVQVFGRKDSQATRRCLRFFKERRVEVSFVDVSKRSPAPAELRRFSRRLGAAALLDEESKAYRKAGLGYLAMDDEEVMERVLADPGLLRLPLVRYGNELSVGVAEPTWRTWQVST